MLGLLALCEFAGALGYAPSLLGGGWSYLLGLYHLAPSLLGAFLAQVILRPHRNELLATLGLAALFGYPLYVTAAATSGEIAIVVAASQALGCGAIVVLAAQALRVRGAPRDAVTDVLFPALILPGFLIVANPMLYLTAVLAPTTYDHHLYLADAAFGAPLSFEIARLAGSFPWLLQICLAVYVALPVPLMLVHALRHRRGLGTSNAMVAFVAVMTAGYLVFLLVPVAGPYFAFGERFPFDPPPPGTITATRTSVPPVPRNCMPSLHSAWALLIWWHARPLGVALRALAALFLGFTLLATVVSGFHYVVDLVAAVPFTMAIQAWATRLADATSLPERAAHQRLRVGSDPRQQAVIAGLAMTAGWIVLVTWGVGLLQGSPALAWGVALTVVVGSWYLKRRVDEDPAAKHQSGTVSATERSRRGGRRPPRCAGRV